ncbi:hypothetical protein ACWCWD_25235 [Streptomyces sp. NPDC001493]
MAVESAAVVVNATGPPAFDASSSSFFRATTDNLPAAAGGVEYAVVLSIVGIDRVADVP